MGAVSTNAVTVDDSRDLVRAVSNGPALIVATRIERDGRTVRAISAFNVGSAPTPEENINTDEDVAAAAADDELVVRPDVYPGTLSLVPGGTRQLKVHVIDPYTSLENDVYTASQLVHAATPEVVETYTDPDTGEAFSYTIPATQAVYSATRYVVSDATVASVSADGLITALREGDVTITIVHLASNADESGNIVQQIIGETAIRLTVSPAQIVDNNPDTPAPAAIMLTAAEGGDTKRRWQLHLHPGCQFQWC